jgi:hypothetical protein
MRLRVVGALGVVCAVSVAAMLGASSARADGGALGNLASDITFSGLPAVQQTGLLQRVALAEAFVSASGPAYPPSPCAATGLVDSIGFTTQGLSATGAIGPEEASVLIAAVRTANGAILNADFPPSPCYVAFLPYVDG